MKNEECAESEERVLLLLLLLLLCVLWLGGGGMGSCGEVAGSRLEKTRFG